MFGYTLIKDEQLEKIEQDLMFYRAARRFLIDENRVHEKELKETQKELKKAKTKLRLISQILCNNGKK